MSKWFGKIGYNSSHEEEAGVWVDSITEREYYGDVISDRWRRQNSGEVNDNINLSNTISIVADQYAYQNCNNMVYVEIRGTKWKVSDIDMSQYPRLILSIGGVWNENTSGTSE